MKSGTFITARDRTDLFRQLEGYVAERSEELGSGRLSHDLVKSYLLETSALGLSRDGTSDAIAEGGWRVEPIDEDLFFVHGQRDAFSAYVERFSARYLVVYTTARSEAADAAVGRLVRRSTSLDHLWFFGHFLNQLFSRYVAAHGPGRWTRMRFEFDDLFGLANPEEPIDTDLDIIRMFDRAPERRGSVFAITERIGRAQDLLPRFRQIESAFEDMTLLRLPAVGARGGHDLYYMGKVTNRSESFREHRSQLLSLVRIYRALSERIEQRAWFSFEHSAESAQMPVRGAPIIFRFSRPLSHEVFENFIEISVRQGRGPFRLLGRPIEAGSGRYHVYGIDQHLWQEVWLDLSPEAWTLVLPRGTCGNTISRFAANIQRYVDPRVTIDLGRQSLVSILDEVLQPPVA